MNIQDLEKKIRQILPSASLDVDNDGQIIIYTNLSEDDDGTLQNYAQSREDEIKSSMER